MNSKEFLKSRLVDLSAEYPATTIKYYFDAFDDDHFVCIYPNSDLEQIIAKKAIAIDREFIKSFPTESLSFIEVDYNLIFDELVAEYEPVIIKEVKTINYSQLIKRNSYHFTENINYKEPIYPVRKISDNVLLLEKEDEEYAIAA